LERLKDRLADREEEMADLRLELEQFAARYTMEVGRFYARMDEIEAEICEEEYKLVPDDEEIKKRALDMRRRAEESAARAREAVETAPGSKPTPEAKKAYHKLARVIHPDLSLNEEEKERRHALMARLNAAYAEGNQTALNKMVEDFRDSPDLVSGNSIGDTIVRVIRQIAQIKRRLIELRQETSASKSSEQFLLLQKVKEESARGRDLLGFMAERTKTHIQKSERRLANLRNVNEAAEEYVKERYDMDISDFR